MARKRRKAPKIELHPMFLWIRGKMGKIVYRLTRNGNVSAYPTPDTPALARRCKCDQGAVEPGPEGPPPVLAGVCGECEAGRQGPGTPPVLSGDGEEEQEE